MRQYICALIPLELAYIWTVITTPFIYNLWQHGYFFYKKSYKQKLLLLLLIS